MIEVRLLLWWMRRHVDGSSHNVIDEELETREARCETERDVIKAELEGYH